MAIAMSRIELPTLSETPGKDWISFGLDNNYVKVLTDTLDTSSVHSAIIEAKAAGVAGDTIGHNSEAVTTEASAKFLKFINAPNPDEDLHELVQKWAMDFEVYGAFCVEVIWAKNGKISEVNHIDPYAIRIGKPVDGKVKSYWYSDDWTNYRKDAYKPVEIPAFDPENYKQGRQLLYVKAHRSGSKWYGVPKYIAALSWIKLDSELSKFHLANIQNGMASSLIINFRNGIPTTEEQDRIAWDIKNKYQGAANSGKVIITFSENADSAPEYTTLAQKDLDKAYIVLNDQLMQNILTAHRVTSPLLIGIKTAGQLGATKELEEAYKIWEKDVLSKSRTKLVKALNRLMPFIAEGVVLSISSASPFAFTFSEALLQKIMLVGEMRGLINLSTLDPTIADEMQRNLYASNHGEKLVGAPLPGGNESGQQTTPTPTA
jgi:hypothetical protein